jgi:predicted Zn-dependent protease
VAASSLQGNALVELKPGPKNTQPMDTLRKGLKLDQGARFESGSVNGNPAAFAAGSLKGKPVLAAAISHEGSQYLLAALAKDGNAYNQHRNDMKATINSFHKLTPEERQLARPHAIRVVQAQPGTTMAQLAAQSPLEKNAEAQLRLINDLYPSGEPKPGQLIKIIQ